MTIRPQYASQTEVAETGAEIDGRVRKAARIFEKHLCRAGKLLDSGCGMGNVGTTSKRSFELEVHGV
jgi:hypothetical protein